MDQIKVGVGVIIMRDNEILLGYRLSKHGGNKWAFPGGHVEPGEDPQKAIIRETFEETGLELSSLEKVTFTNDLFENRSQYITLFYKATDWKGILENKEPDKCLYWKWFDPNTLPKPLFEPIVSLLNDPSYYTTITAR